VSEYVCVTLFVCIAYRRLHKIGNNSGRICSSSKPQGYSVTFRVKEVRVTP